MSRALLLCVAGALLAGGVSRPMAAAPRVCQAVAVPAGSGSPAAVEPLAGFTDGDTARPAEVQTRAAIACDGANLLLRVECHEPRMDALRALCVESDGAVFADDCIEVFVQPDGAGAPYYHFAANARGTRFEERLRDTHWNGRWSVKAGRSASGWSLEITVPFATLGARPARGDLWRLNIGRERQAGGKTQLSAWSPTGSNFHDRDLFGYLLLDSHYADCLGRHVLAPWEQRSRRLSDRLRSHAPAGEKVLARLEALRPRVTSLRGAGAGGRALALAEFEPLLQEGEAVLRALGDLETDTDTLLAGVEAAARMRRLAGPGERCVAYAVRPITNEKVLPVPAVPRAPSRRLSLAACRGEYEPASFVLYPFTDLAGVQVSATDLNAPGGGVLPAGAVDLSAIKCWYQSGSGGMYPINERKKVLTPELLLKEDALVRVDHEAKENYLRLAFPDGRVQWRWISNPKPTPEENDWSIAGCPVQDARTLQPLDLRANTAKQFWVTVHVPGDAHSGIYRGRIEIRTLAGPLCQLPLEVEVLPFDLEQNPLDSSMYCHWCDHIEFDGPGAIKRTLRSAGQYRRQMENLVAHGVDNPIEGARYDKDTLPKILRMRREAGMTGERLYYLGAYTWSPAEQQRHILEVARSFGYQEVYFYGQDEATGDALKAQRAQWEALHALGGKVMVAGYVGDNFTLMGDIQDLLVCAGRPTKEEAARWHGKGHRIFCYAHPQSGIEEPETYRRNYGLLLAQNHYDGGMTFLYFDQWNDFNGKPYRGHNFVYPTVDGVIDTIQWEGYREGIDDLRYLGTLRKAVADAERGPSERAHRDAAEARRFLERIDVSGDLYALREGMIRRIRRLRR